MQTLLFVTPELPYPARSGGKLKSLKLLKHLATQNAVTVVCPLKAEDQKHLAAFRKEIGAQLENIICVPVNVPRTALNLGRSYLKNQPLNVLRTASSALHRRVNEIEGNFDTVFLDHFEVFQYLPLQHKGAVVYHAHNAYHKMWERYAETITNPLIKTAAKLEAVRIRRYERQICARADLVLAAPGDIAALIEAGADAGKMKETYHLGDDSQLALPDLEFNEQGTSLVYVGYLGWEANVLGLLWFIEKVWPELMRQRPELSLKIVGKDADDRLVQIVSQHENITLVGFVDDLDSVFSEASLCVAPLTFGSGMKVKVLSAMARGIPVATTRIGAESIEVKHREHLMIADAPSEMADHILELLSCRATWERLATSSRQRIKEKYTWSALFGLLDTQLHELAA